MRALTRLEIATLVIQLIAPLVLIAHVALARHRTGSALGITAALALASRPDARPSGCPDGRTPLPIPVDGRYLVHNDRMHERRQSEVRGHH